MKNRALEITHEQQITAASNHQNRPLNISQKAFEFIGGCPFKQMIGSDIHAESVPAGK